MIIIKGVFYCFFNTNAVLAGIYNFSHSLPKVFSSAAAGKVKCSIVSSTNPTPSYVLLSVLKNPGPEKDTDEWREAEEKWKEFWVWKYRPIREGDSWTPDDEENYFTL